MRHLKCFRVLFLQSLVRAMAYRVNFINVMITISTYFVVQLLFIHLVFQHVDTLVGWTKYEMFVYMGTLNIIDSLWVFGPFFNLLAIPSLVRSGALDYYLTKPVNSQFLVSLRNVDISSLISLLSGVLIITYAMVQGEIGITLLSLILYVVAIFHALLAMYSVFFILTCLSFWLVKADFVDQIHGVLWYFASRPIDIYKGPLRLLLSYVLPYGLIFTVTSKAGINNIESLEYVSFILLCWLFFLASTLAWRFSLRYYSSASS